MRREFDFVKYHGCGNDFIVRDETKGGRTSDRDRSKMSRFLCDRHFNIGADGILFVESAPGLDGSMRLFEPAGNEADMCGNGIRCIAAYLMEKLGKNEVDVLTRDGVKHIIGVKNDYRVEMGYIRTLRSDLRQYVSDRGKDSDTMLDFSVKVSGKTLRASIVNSGEPHIVVRVRDIDAVDAVAIGEEVNSDKSRFPGGVNLNFVKVIGPHTISVRTYERGVYDETLACGTGATASAGVALMRKWVEPGTVNVQTRGGKIKIRVEKDGRAFMTGPATKVFEGRITVEL